MCNITLGGIRYFARFESEVFTERRARNPEYEFERKTISITRGKTPLITLLRFSGLLFASGIVAGLGARSTLTADIPFGPQNPFYSPSTLPFQGPPFDKIKDADY